MRALVTIFVFVSSISAVQAANNCATADQLANKSEQIFDEYLRLSDVAEYLKARSQNEQDKYHQNPVVLNLASDATNEANKKSAEASELAKKALSIYRTNSCK